MKKILIVAALMATTVMPVTTVSAADMATPATPKLSPACFFLPLLPDCIAAWKAEHDSMMSKMAAPAKTAMAAPKLMTMPTCTKAAAGAGHLYDCKM
ncbi:MAG TPA: hypothetical protein VHA07_07205 [Devosia sp.]|nr:hypothetical protein [Devosia sp.]